MAGEFDEHGRTTRRRFLGAVSLSGAAAVAHSFASASPAAAAAPALAGNGVTDDAPAIQRAYDEGTIPAFQAGRTYLLNSPIFLDKPSSLAMFPLDLNGAILLLGPNLPTTDAFWRDEAVKWAVFPNTERAARSGTKVAVSPGSRASGDNTGALVSLVVRNGTIDGNGANVGFAFSNRTAVRFESVVLRRARALLSWFDYCDANVLLQCHNRGGGPDASVLVDQVASGDGLLMRACKADASVGLARLKYCRGAEITATVTGRIELDSCAAVVVRAGHQETPIANQTMFDIRSSEVVIDATAIYLARGAIGASLPPAIRVNDAGSVPSSVVLRDVVEMRALLTSDQQLGALLAIDAAIAGTRVEARGLVSKVSASGLGGVWSPSAGPVVAGTTAVATAADAARDVLATGDFELSDPGDGWVVRRTTAGTTAGSTAGTIASSGAPSVSVDSTGAIGGSLGLAAKRYRVQSLMPGRVFTPASGYSGAAIPLTGALRLSLSTKGGAQALRIWRYGASSTTADAYVEVPAGRTGLTLYDTGRALSGFRWLDGSTVAVRST